MPRPFPSLQQVLPTPLSLGSLRSSLDELKAPTREGLLLLSFVLGLSSLLLGTGCSKPLDFSPLGKKLAESIAAVSSHSAAGVFLASARNPETGNSPTAASKKAPLLAQERVPETRSTPPASTDWAGAKRVRLARSPSVGAGCQAWRIREWLKIDCGDDPIEFSLLSGKSTDVFFQMDPFIDRTPPSGGYMVLRMQRGDFRVIQSFSFTQFGYGGGALSASNLIEEDWSGETEGPVVTVAGIPSQ